MRRLLDETHASTLALRHALETALGAPHGVQVLDHFNPYYLAYVVLSGAASIAEARERDARNCPIGCVFCSFNGFMSWEWRQFRARHQLSHTDGIPPRIRAVFENELAERVAGYRVGARAIGSSAVLPVLLPTL